MPFAQNRESLVEAPLEERMKETFSFLHTVCIRDLDKYCKNDLCLELCGVS